MQAWSAAKIFLAGSLLLVGCALPVAAQMPPTFVVDPAKFIASTALPVEDLPSATVEPTGTAVPTAAPTASATPAAPTATATAEPTATPAPCLNPQGVYVDLLAPAVQLAKPIFTHVYLPPCYLKADGRAYPVLYLLHGMNQTPDIWDQVGLLAVADQLIVNGEIPPLVIVMPRVNESGNFAAALAADLVPHIDSVLRTLPERSHRALGGISRGGGWALRSALDYPQVFGALGLHSLAIIWGDDNRITKALNRSVPAALPRFYLDIGVNDSLQVSAAWLDGMLSVRNIEHTYLVQPGFHGPAYWRAQLPDYLRWYGSAWGDLPRGP
ncbi:MAG: alpha/beta hydrolase-fold protein [Chloroflexi bacterium]|nr:alpha/beta hydrolase-fold protein [Chloroflexota bacterium]